MKLAKLFIGIMILTITPYSFAGKVAVLNLDKALLGTEAAKKADKTLQARADYAAMITKAEGLKADYEALVKEAKTQSETWPADKKADSDKKIKKAGEDLQGLGKKIQSENQAAMMKIMQDMQPKFKAAVDEVIAAEKIDLLINSQAVMFVVPALDITSLVTDKLNKAK